MKNTLFIIAFIFTPIITFFYLLFFGYPSDSFVMPMITIFSIIVIVLGLGEIKNEIRN